MIDWWIIEKSLQQELSDEENGQLQHWLEESPAHRQLYEKVRHPENIASGVPAFEVWRRAFRRQLQAGARRRRIRRIGRWGSVAAAILLAGFGGYRWYAPNRPVVPVEQAAIYQEPDRNKVRLFTARGEVLELSDFVQQDTLLIDGIRVAKQEGGLSYGMAPKRISGPDVGMNKVEVPRGAEFCITLNDGSRVWLNSDSRMSYPVAFTGDKREVELSGEAFFEVSRNAEKPFVVHVQGMTVAVLGTEFNINTRRPEQVQTTLVRGKVGVKAGEQPSVILQPGEQASTDIQSGKTVKGSVNIQKYVAWRYGKYCFENATLEEILGELALWYDVKVEFQEEKLREEKFSGYLSRGETITSILGKIEQTTYVHFSVVENRIVVKH